MGSTSAKLGSSSSPIPSDSGGSWPLAGPQSWPAAPRPAPTAFEVLALVDRGLAYAPDDPRLVELAGRLPEAPSPGRSSPSWIAGAAVLIGLIAVALIALAGSGSGDGETEPLAPPAVRVERNTADDLVAATAGERAASQRRSGKAATRVASGFGQLLLRGLAAERDADGNLVARQGGPGETSNQELTLSVMGGLLDLFEEGMEAKKRDDDGETITIPALDPANLSDADEPRRPALLEAGDEAPGPPRGQDARSDRGGHRRARAPAGEGSR